MGKNGMFGSELVISSEDIGPLPVKSRKDLYLRHAIKKM